MNNTPYQCLAVEAVPVEPGWLESQPVPVIAVGDGSAPNADVVVADDSDLPPVLTAIERCPVAAMTLVQVLRAVPALPVQAAMTIESLAYATLQAGPEYARWLRSREKPPREIRGGDGPAIVMWRENDILKAELNRPSQRNSLTVEMRDALVELFELTHLDTSITRLELSARGRCFSVGGELREFGLAPDAATAHWVRSRHNPARLLARCAGKVHCRVHSACLGSGIEIPAFAGHVSASANSFFQLPELNFGLIPGAGGCVSISRRIGRQHTGWLALSGRKINASQALAWGLVDELYN